MMRRASERETFGASTFLASVMEGARASSAILAVAGLFALAAEATAHSYQFGAISVGHIWLKPTHASEADVYGPLLNQGKAEDQLVAAATPVAARVELRFGEEEAARDFISLPPNKPVSLAPWGFRLRLVGLAQPLSAGESVPLTLTFRGAGTREVHALVEEAPGH
jgi:hypothetical protein